MMHSRQQAISLSSGKVLMSSSPDTVRNDRLMLALAFLLALCDSLPCPRFFPPLAPLALLHFPSSNSLLFLFLSSSLCLLTSFFFVCFPFSFLISLSRFLLLIALVVLLYRLVHHHHRCQLLPRLLPLLPPPSLPLHPPRSLPPFLLLLSGQLRRWEALLLPPLILFLAHRISLLAAHVLLRLPLVIQLLRLPLFLPLSLPLLLPLSLPLLLPLLLALPLPLLLRLPFAPRVLRSILGPCSRSIPPPKYSTMVCLFVCLSPVIPSFNPACLLACLPAPFPSFFVSSFLISSSSSTFLSTAAHGFSFCNAFFFVLFSFSFPFLPALSISSCCLFFALALWLAFDSSVFRSPLFLCRLLFPCCFFSSVCLSFPVQHGSKHRSFVRSLLDRSSKRRMN